MEFNATFIVAMFSFVVFILIMNAIYYKPVLKIIDERKALIDGNYAQARVAGEKTIALQEENSARLGEASKRAKHIVNQGVDKAVDDAASQASAAQKQSQADVAKAKKKLAVEEEKIAAALDIKDLSKSISAKILKGGVNEGRSLKSSKAGDK